MRIFAHCAACLTSAIRSVLSGPERLQKENKSTTLLRSEDKNLTQNFQWKGILVRMAQVTDAAVNVGDMVDEQVGPLLSQFATKVFKQPDDSLFESLDTCQHTLLCPVLC